MDVDIKQLLSPADVIVGLRASDKQAALQALTRHLATKASRHRHAAFVVH